MIVKREGERVRENNELRGGKKKDQDQTRPDRRDQTRRSRLGWANKAGVSADTGAQCALETCARGQKPMRVRCPGAVQPLLRAFRYRSHQQACGLRLCPQQVKFGLHLGMNEEEGGGVTQ